MKLARIGMMRSLLVQTEASQNRAEKESASANRSWPE